MSTFSENLEFGQAGEGLIAKWLISRGCSVLPVYEKIIDNGKGPRMFTGTGNLVAPDIIAFGRSVTFIEAKRKTGFTWNRKYQRLVTWIDLRHHRDYVEVAKKTNMPLWLLFLQHGKVTKDFPKGVTNPDGLFGANIAKLITSYSHIHEGGGPHMIYWEPEPGGPLKLIAGIDEINRLA